MHVGHYISGAGHILLLGWAFIGGAFESEPLPMEVAEVTLMTGEEYAALVAPDPSPEAAPGVAQPEAPAPETATPEAPAAETPPERPAPPEAARDPAPDATPVPPAPPTPAPEVAEPDPAPELAPPSEAATLLPEETPRPAPRPADRVAPTPAPPAPPQAESAPDATPQAAPAPDAPPAPQEPPAAPEEAAPEIVTEAEEAPAGAPRASLRPPARPAPRPEPEPETETAEAPRQSDSEVTQPYTEATQRALDDILAGAAGSSGASGTGEPLSQSEIGAIVAAIGRSWNVDPGSRSAEITVTVGFELDENGRLVSTPELVSASGGDQRALQAAFRRARTAIIEAARQGRLAGLPPEKYENWKRIEMVFNPSEMRLR